MIIKTQLLQPHWLSLEDIKSTHISNVIKQPTASPSARASYSDPGNVQTPHGGLRPPLYSQQPRTPCSDGHLDDVSSPPLSSGGEEGFEPLARSNNVKPRFKELLSLPLHPTPQAGWRTSAWCHLVPAPHWKLLYLYTLKCYSYIAGE